MGINMHSTNAVRGLVGAQPISIFIELDIDNPSSVNDVHIGLDMNLSGLNNCYTKTEVGQSLASKHIGFLFGEVPATSTSRLFDYNDNEFRAIHVNNPRSIQTTNDAF